MEQEFELIAKTFQGMEDLLVQELAEAGAQNIKERTARGLLHRRHLHDVSRKLRAAHCHTHTQTFETF